MVRDKSRDEIELHVLGVMQMPSNLLQEGIIESLTATSRETQE